MEKKFKRTTVTSALPYANGPVHIGHLAGVYVPADIYVRYLRLKKEDVIFIGGSDEHGVPITIRAKKEGVTPQDIVDRYHTLIKESFKEFGISFDVYSRTSSKTHHDTASEFFRKLYDKGDFIEKTSMQYYDEEAKTFLAVENHMVPDFFFFVPSVSFRCLVHISLPPNSHCLKFVCRRTVQRKREPVGWNVLPDFRWNLASLTCQR